MKVWVIIADDIEDHSLEFVHASEEGAEAHLAELTAAEERQYGNSYRWIEDFEVLP